MIHFVEIIPSILLRTEKQGARIAGVGVQLILIKKRVKEWKNFLMLEKLSIHKV